MASINVEIDPAALRPLIEEVVEQTVTRLQEQQAALSEKLAYSEAEAARLLGIGDHVLRDERRRGRIEASQIVGRRVRYLREDLLAYLRGRRSNGEQ